MKRCLLNVSSADNRTKLKGIHHENAKVIGVGCWIGGGVIGRERGAQLRGGSSRDHHRRGQVRQVRLERGLGCGKCNFKTTKECQNVIQTEKDGKTVNYYLVANDVSKEFHGKLCKESKKVTATGTVKEVDGKLQLTATKIELAEKE